VVLTYFGACFVWIIFIPCLFHSLELASVTRFRVLGLDWIPSLNQRPSDLTISTSPSRYLANFHFLVQAKPPPNIDSRFIAKLEWCLRPAVPGRYALCRLIGTG